MRGLVEGGPNDLADDSTREQCSRPAEEAERPSAIDAGSLADSIRRHIEPIGGVDLELPPREAPPEPLNLGE